MSDLLQETRVSLTQLARQEGVSIPTTWRWAMRGIQGSRLKTILIGGRRYTTQEAFTRFVEATTEAADAKLPNLPINRQIQATNSQVEAKLKEEGFNC